MDEHAPNGTVVDVAIGVDPVAGDTLTYSLIDDAGGRFAIDPNDGEVTVANGTLLDFETAATLRDRIEELSMQHELQGPKGIARERRRRKP